MRAQPQACIAALAALLLLTSSCLTEATEVVVIVGTDLPPDFGMTLRATVRTGNVQIVDDRREIVRTIGAVDGGIELPASFGVTPGSSSAIDAPVTLLIEIVTASFTLHRLAHFTFQRGHTATLRLFLSGACAGPSSACTTVPIDQCTVEQACAEQGETCGESGLCTSIAVTPTLGAPDGSLGMDTSVFDPDFSRCGPGYSCCAGGVTCSSGQICTAAGQCAVCGANLGCCPDGTVCDAGLLCDDTGMCTINCGGGGQPCCPGDVCNSGMCSGGMCGSAPCGGSGEPCCAGSNCNSGYVCSSGNCVACGGHNQKCCSGGNCHSAYYCSNDRCVCRSVAQSCNSSEPCCSPYVCGTTTAGTVCCGHSGAPCSNSGDCCGNLWCCGTTSGLKCGSAPFTCP